MDAKRTLRIAVDCLMAVLLPLLMAYELVGRAAHEWLGAGMGVLFIAHHILNRAWWKGLPKGCWTAVRILQTAVNALILATMLGSMVSGIAMSRYVFGWLPIPGGRTLFRTVHLLCAFWGFVLMSVHLGLHGGMFLRMGRRVFPQPSKGRAWALRALALLLAVCGAWVFASQDIADYLFLRAVFVFYDFGQPVILFFLQYLSMMLLFALIGYYLMKALTGKHNNDD